MGQITKLKDGSGVSLYPITTADAVFIEDSVTLKSRLGTLWDWYSIATDDSDSVIDTWHEISDFLAGTTDTSTLTGLLAGKANAVHNHDTAYAALNHNHDSAYAALNHNHDGVYAPKNHTHDVVKTTAAGFVPSTANANLVAAPGTYSDKYFMFYGSTNSEYKWGKLPQVGAGNLNFKVGSTTAETFHANYSGADKELKFAGGGATTVSADASTHTITISTPAADAVYNGTLTLKGAGTTVQTFSANQSSAAALDIVGSGGTTVTPDATNKKITISSTSVNNGTLTFKSKNASDNLISVETFGANSDSTKELKFIGSGGTTVTGDSANHQITINSPSVNNGTLSFIAGQVTAKTFSANQSGDGSLTFAGGGSTTVSANDTNNTITISSTEVNNGTFSIKTSTDNKTTQSFSANQSTSPSLKFAGDGATTVTTTTQGTATTAGVITISTPAPKDGTFTIQGNGTSAQSFGANQSTSPTLNFVGGGATTVTTTTAGNATTAGKITISTPAPKDGTLSFKVGQSTAQTFGANSDGTKVLTFAGGGATTVNADSTTNKITISTTVNNGTFTIQGNGTSAQTFTANQIDNATLNFIGGNGIGITPGAGQITISSPINHDKVLKTTGYTYSTSAQDTTILNTIKNALP